jgi:hypothetical protein
MTTCLNPNCDTEVTVVGVCLFCANGNYRPHEHAVQVAPNLVSQPAEHYRGLELVPLHETE